MKIFDLNDYGFDPSTLYEKIAIHTAGLDNGTGPEDILESSERISAELRPGIEDAIPLILDALEGGECAEPVVVRSVPTFDEQNFRGIRANAATLIAVLTACGYQPFSYLEQQSGELVQSIRPQRGLENANSNAGRVRLGWHTDDAVLKRQFRAQGISLLCVNNDSRSRTYYLSASAVRREVGDETFEVLRQPRFRFATPESFNIFGDKLVYSEPRPIFSYNELGQLEISFAEYSTMPAEHDSVAARCISTLRNCLATLSGEGVCLLPGDCLVFSNFRGLHSRDAVDGQRLLRRAYFRRSFEALDSVGAGPTLRTYSCESFILH